MSFPSDIARDNYVSLILILLSFKNNTRKRRNEVSNPKQHIFLTPNMSVEAALYPVSATGILPTIQSLKNVVSACVDVWEELNCPNNSLMASSPSLSLQ